MANTCNCFLKQFCHEIAVNVKKMTSKVPDNETNIHCVEPAGF